MGAPVIGTVDPSSTCLKTAVDFANCFSDVIINPILYLIFAAGLLVFIWGLVQFMGGLASEAGSKEQGKQHMLWGLIGMFIMIACYGILRLIMNTVGSDLTTHF